MFHFIKTYCKKIYSQITERFTDLFARQNIDESFFQNLRDVLLSSDVGTSTTDYIMAELKKQTKTVQHVDGLLLKKELASILKTILQKPAVSLQEKSIFLLVGINGSGKTTTIAKLAYHFISEQKKVLCIAADTFRAAATEQLEHWGKIIGFDVVVGNQNQDPASVVFAGCEKFKHESYDVLLIDTAGRLQTKTHLMAELAKIKRVIEKQIDSSALTTLIVLDALLGQNALIQAKEFQQTTKVDGVILSKMDGTSKGGFIFAIAKELQLPICYISFGETTETIKVFSPNEFVTDLLSTEAK